MAGILQGHILYLSVLAAYTVMLPSSVFDPESRDYLLLIGFIAFWRYTWWGINLMRFLIYTRIVFPKWRKEAKEGAAIFCHLMSICWSLVFVLIPKRRAVCMTA